MDRFVFAKHAVIRGQSFAPGDRFDPSTVAPHKVHQFLRQRLIRPDHNEGTDTGQQPETQST